MRVCVLHWLKLQEVACPKIMFSKESKFLNSLPNDIILDVTKLKAFADEKLHVAKMTISLLDRVGNTVVKGENAGYQHFLLFPQCFPKPFSLWVISSWDLWYSVTEFR